MTDRQLNLFIETENSVSNKPEPLPVRHPEVVGMPAKGVLAQLCEDTFFQTCHSDQCGGEPIGLGICHACTNAQQQILYKAQELGLLKLNNWDEVKRFANEMGVWDNVQKRKARIES